MNTKLPKACDDCAEYGSEFCEECMEELTKDMPEPNRIKFSKILRNLANAITDKND